MTHLEIFKTLSEEFCNRSSINIYHREPIMTHNKVMALSEEAILVVDKYVLPEEYYNSLYYVQKYNLCPNGMYKGTYTKEKILEVLSDSVKDLILKVFEVTRARDCNWYTCTYQGETRQKLLFTEYLYVII